MREENKTPKRIYFTNLIDRLDEIRRELKTYNFGNKAIALSHFNELISILCEEAKYE
jgi:hypothetical protein